MNARLIIRRVSKRLGRSNDRAAAAVEFALIIPLLVTFLYGVVTYGYILSFQQGVTQAATEGSRAAAITSSAESTTARSTKAKAAINNVMAGYKAECGVGGTTCDVTIAACPNDSTRQCATVKVSYNWASDPKIPTFPLVPAPSVIERVSVIEVS